MKNVKVLQLDWWMKSSFKSGELLEDEYMAETYPEISPIFNREGVYTAIIGWLSVCWFEIGGRAFMYDRKTFEHDLKMLNVKPLRKIEYDAYKILRKAKLLSRKEKEKLWDYENWVQCRDVYRNSGKMSLAMTKGVYDGE